MLTYRLSDLILDSANWVQGGHGILEDHRNLFAAYFSHLLVAFFHEIRSKQLNTSVDNLARRVWDQLQD